MRNLGNMIAILYRREQMYISHAMEEYHLTPSAYKFLVLLSHHEGCSQRDLSVMLSIDEAMATRAIRKLLDLKYIIRKKENNKRTYCLYLTDSGRSIVPALEKRLQMFWDEVMPNLNAEDKKMFYRILEDMVNKDVKL